jgi:hypothetical protein
MHLTEFIRICNIDPVQGLLGSDFGSGPSQARGAAGQGAWVTCAMCYGRAADCVCPVAFSGAGKKSYQSHEYDSTEINDLGFRVQRESQILAKKVSI